MISTAVKAGAGAAFAESCCCSSSSLRIGDPRLLDALRILRHLGLWQEGVRVHCGTDPPGETTLAWLEDPLPAYDTKPVIAFFATRNVRQGPECASHTLFSGSQSTGTVFDFRPDFCQCSKEETDAFGFRLRPTPRRAKGDFLAVITLCPSTTRKRVSRN